MANITYYPRCIGDEKWGDNPKRKEFYDKWDKIREQAVKVEVERGDFYNEITYTLEDGRKFIFTEDNDYMIPYSIEEVS